MDRAKAAFPSIHTFRSDVSDPEAIATLYEKVTNSFPSLTFWALSKNLDGANVHAAFFRLMNSIFVAA